MKVILEFNLPEETSEAEMAKNGMAYFAALWEIRELCVGIINGGSGKTTVDFARQILNAMNERLPDFGNE